jgi:ATP/ADP translocase
MGGKGEIVWRLLPAVRPAERSRVVFFTALLTLISAAQTLGLAGSEALLLAEIGAGRLPEIFIAASLVTVLGSVVYAARVGHSRNDRLLARMLVGAAVALAAGGAAAGAGVAVALVLPGLFCLFYLTQAVFLNHFWTFSGDYFDTLASKRLFPVFVVGASLGGLVGGAAAVALTSLAGPASLVLCWGALLLAAALMLRLARRVLRRWGPLELEEADETSVEGMRGAARYLRVSPLGRWLVVAALGMVLALFVAQYVYSQIFVAAYPDPAELAAFFGAYLAVTNLIEIPLVLGLTPWLIHRFGVPTAQLVHPALTLLSFGGLMLHHGLYAGVGARVARELVENAVAQPIRALVYNALPQRLRGRIRAFLDGIVVYGGMSAAGVLLLVLGDPDPLGLAAVGGAAALVYLIASVRVRREYLHELVAGIRAGRLDFGALGDEIGDLEASQLEELSVQLLREETVRPSQSLLRLLPTLARRGLAQPLLAGALHPHALVRAVCIRELAGLPGQAKPLDAIRRALRDPDPHVRLAALEGLAGEPDLASACAELQADHDPLLRAAAAARRGLEGVAVLRQMLRARAPGTAIAALGVAPAELAQEVLDRTSDPDPRIRAAALGRAAVVAAGRELPAGTLRGALAARDPAVRTAAVALAAVAAPPELSAVADALADPATPVRRAAVTALISLRAAGAQAAAPYLRDGREPAAEAALRVTAAAAAPARRAPILRTELLHRARAMWYCVLAYQSLPADADTAPAFLRAAYADALLRHRRLAFRALSLLENERIVHKVERALRASAQRTRADALEVLSNLGDREAAQLMVLMHETAPLAVRRGRVEAIVRVPLELASILRDASRSESRWMRAAAAAVDPALGHNELGIDVMERLLALKRVPLFANLTLDQLEAIHQLAQEVTFLPNEVVMREGEAGSELYILLEGVLDVYLGWETPEQRCISQIRAVDYVGEMAILDDEPRSATIVAVEPARLLSLEGESLKDLILQMPDIAFEIFRVLTRRVRVAERRLQEG